MIIPLNIVFNMVDNGILCQQHEQLLYLVVSNIFHFPFHIWDNASKIDELIFFKMVIAPPSSYGILGCVWTWGEFRTRK